MSVVRAKKHLGQHFLKDINVARKIVDNLITEKDSQVLEVGPGMGVLTQFLIQRPEIRLKVIEIDTESVNFLKTSYPELRDHIIEADFLSYPLSSCFTGLVQIIGNFPYNISSQIFFKILENRNQVPQVVGMIQKEVAERISSPCGSKTYGILSVLLQAFYDIDYLFTVNQNVFTPPPKIKSAVIRLTRNKTINLDCNEKLFRTIVKTGFNQRRKMLRNSLKNLTDKVPPEFAELRPEQLDVNQFISLTKQVESRIKS